MIRVFTAILSLVALSIAFGDTADAQTSEDVTPLVDKIDRFAAEAGLEKPYGDLLALATDPDWEPRYSSNTEQAYAYAQAVYAYGLRTRMLLLALTGYESNDVSRLQRRNVDLIAAALRNREYRSAIDDVINSDLIAIATITGCALENHFDDQFHVSLSVRLDETLYVSKPRANRLRSVTIRQLGGMYLENAIMITGPNTIACEAGRQGLLHLSNATYRFLAAGGQHRSRSYPDRLTSRRLRDVFVQSGPSAWSNQQGFQERVDLVRSAVAAVK